jgi:hypothetical protein
MNLNMQLYLINLRLFQPGGAQDMNSKTDNKTIFPLSLPIACMLAMTMVSSVMVQGAAANPNAQAIQSALTTVSFVPPTDEQMDQSRGGASRLASLKCYHDRGYDQPLKSLVPGSQEGLTTQGHPTFWVHIPDTDAHAIHLTLRTGDGQGLYQTQIPLGQTNGIMGITLPQQAPELEPGQSYRWSLALLCNSPQADIPFVEGYVRRVEPGEMPDSDVADSDVAAQTLLAQAATYGQSGIWYDALTALATLKLNQPENHTIGENWVNLLTEVGLGGISQQPLLQPVLSNE